jgi:hypothetical protein
MLIKPEGLIPASSPYARLLDAPEETPETHKHTRYLRRLSAPPGMRDSACHLNRCPEQGMESGDFLCLLRRHRRGRYDSCGVERNRWGDRTRDLFSMKPMGTLWFSTPTTKDMLFPVRANGLPYVSVQDVTMLENGTVTSGEVAKGWRATISDLVETGYLRPSEQLSLLIGEDTFGLAVRFYESEPA